MAYERNPNDPSRPLSDDSRATRAERERSAEELDNRLQVDPELAEGPANFARVALFAIAIAAVLGVVFYGMNASTTRSPTNSAQTTTTPNAPPIRDVTPPAKSNGQPGTTTGSSATPDVPAPPNAGSQPADSTKQ